MILTLTKKTLYKKCEPVEFKNQLVTLSMSKQLTAFMRKHNALGLAANQVGLNKRMFVMQAGGKLRIVCNPKIITHSSITEKGSEGCLSFKDEYIEVDRPSVIDVQYQTWAGHVVEEMLGGLEARCFLHEYDHLEGITMYKRNELNGSAGNPEEKLIDKRL
jgi:peptide deformylase